MPKFENAPRKKSYLLIGIVLFLIVAAGIYVLQKNFQSEPKVSRDPVPRMLPADVSEFFSTLRESIRETTEGKKHYLTALKLLNTPGETASSSAKERFSPAAEKFAVALEHFRLAEKSLKD